MNSQDPDLTKAIKEDVKQQILEMYGLGGITLTRENIIGHVETNVAYVIGHEEINDAGELEVHLIARKGDGLSRTLRFTPKENGAYEFAQISSGS
jgi:hypothetical protein